METPHLTFEMLYMLFAFFAFAIMGHSISSKMRDRGYFLHKRLKRRHV